MLSSLGIKSTSDALGIDSIEELVSRVECLRRDEIASIEKVTLRSKALLVATVTCGERSSEAASIMISAMQSKLRLIDDAEYGDASQFMKAKQTREALDQEITNTEFLMHRVSDIREAVRAVRQFEVATTSAGLSNSVLERISLVDRTLSKLRDCNAAVVTRLRSRHEQLRVQLLHRIEESFYHLVHLLPVRGKIDIKSTTPAHASLLDILSLAEALGMHDRLVDPLVDYILSSFVSPLLSCKDRAILVTRDLTAELTTLPPAEISATLTGDVTFDALSLYPQLLALFSFLNELLGDHRVVKTYMGRRLWSSEENGLARAILTRLQDRVPETTGDLLAFQHIVKATEDMELRLVTMGFLGDISEPTSLAGSTATSSLAEFVSDIDSRFAQRKRREYLGIARHTILHDFHTLVPLSRSEDKSSADGNGFAALPSMQVSLSAKSILKVCEEALVEAGRTTPRCAVVLYQTARDALDLYRALLSDSQGDNLAASPLSAAVYHNDCMFLAHYAMTLLHKHRTKLPEPLSKTATTADFVHVFRSMAQSTLNDQADLQWQSIRKFLKTDMLDAASESDAGFEAAEKGVKRAVDLLNSLATTWTGVLSKPTYLLAFGKIIDAVMSLLASYILDKRDIGADESHQLHYLYTSILDAEFMRTIASYTQAQLASTVPRLDTLLQVHRILEMTLQDVETNWEKGKLAALSNKELRGLIRFEYCAA